MISLGPMFLSQFTSLLGEGVFNADGTQLLSLHLAVTDPDNRRNVEVRTYLRLQPRTWMANSMA